MKFLPQHASGGGDRRPRISTDFHGLESGAQVIRWRTTVSAGEDGRPPCVLPCLSRPAITKLAGIARSLPTWVEEQFANTVWVTSSLRDISVALRRSKPMAE